MIMLKYLSVYRPVHNARYFASATKFWKKHSIVPDIIDTTPARIATVDYYGIQVKFGNVLKPVQVKHQPIVSWQGHSKTFYLLCMIDPDAPSRKEPTFREWHHWLVGNIVGNDVDTGEILSAYIGAGPPKGTGLHRYVFLIYKQTMCLFFDEPRLSSTSAENRGGFSIRKFAAKYKLGQPIAGNFFRAQYDDYVPQLYKQLGK